MKFKINWIELENVLSFSFTIDPKPKFPGKLFNMWVSAEASHAAATAAAAPAPGRHSSVVTCCFLVVFMSARRGRRSALGAGAATARASVRRWWCCTDVIQWQCWKLSVFCSSCSLCFRGKSFGLFQYFRKYAQILHPCS